MRTLFARDDCRRVGADDYVFAQRLAGLLLKNLGKAMR